jgi:methionine synthase II (cobalamin-independent)
VTSASGIGSWPGEDVRRAVTVVRDLLGDDGLPYLPELPARGPGADLVGRTAALLVDLPVDLQPSGWRLVDRPGRDLQRARSFLGRDLDELAEAYDGYTGALKVQVGGPWTLASSVWLPRGERVAVDEGACRDLVDSLAEGVREHLATVSRAVSGASLVLQLDEPSLPAALAGRLPTASGYGRVRPLEPAAAADGLRAVLSAASDAGARTVVHCCAKDVPLPLLRSAGPDAVALDTTLLDGRGWESVAATVEAGVELWAGVLQVTDDGGAAQASSVKAVIDPVVRAWHGVGLPVAALDRVTLTPACGLAGATPNRAEALQRRTLAAARALAETAAG